VRADIDRAFEQTTDKLQLADRGGHRRPRFLGRGLVLRLFIQAQHFGERQRGGGAGSQVGALDRRIRDGARAAEH
jgi:hypothetical protein